MRLLRPLRHRPMALLWSGLALSATGDQLYVVALAWVAVRAFGANAGYLSALQALAVVVAALFGGAFLDRLNQRRTMIAADLARGAVLVLLVALWSALGHPPAALLVLCVLVLAAGQAAFQPALQSVIPELTPEPGLLPAANGLLDATSRVARLLGPGLVGLLAGIVPLAQFFTLDAASFAASAAAVTLIGPAGAPHPAPAHRSHPLLAIRRGFAATARDRLLLIALCLAGPINGAWYAAMFLALPYGFASQGGIGRYGLVLTAYGVTNLLANLVVANGDVLRRPGRLLIGGEIVVGAGMALMGVVETMAHGLALAVGCALAAAFGALGGPMSDITVAVLRQTRLAASDLPAAMRAYMVASYAGLLAAMLVTPALLRGFGYAPVTIGAGLTMVAISAAAIPFLPRQSTRGAVPGDSRVEGSRG